jgi:hypothetical protein
MRRMDKACTNDSHPLYGIFMAKLSKYYIYIFEWDGKDVDLLREAKKFELVLAGFKNPSTDAVNKFISKVELAKHCKRLTREPEKTVRLIEDLIRSLRLN